MISLPSLDEHGCGLRVDFVWQDDRFAHSIAVVENDSRFVAWESNPLGPVFQQLHEQDDPEGRPMVLLVGAVGQMHWSMSVLALEAGKIGFDVAGRSKADSNAKFSATKDATHYSRGSKAAELLLGHKVATLADSADTAIFQDHIRTSVWATNASALHSPYTVRWKYSMVSESSK